MRLRRCDLFLCFHTLWPTKGCLTLVPTGPLPPAGRTARYQCIPLQQPTIGNSAAAAAQQEPVWGSTAVSGMQRMPPPLRPPLPVH